MFSFLINVIAERPEGAIVYQAIGNPLNWQKLKLSWDLETHKENGTRENFVVKDPQNSKFNSEKKRGLTRTRKYPICAMIQDFPEFLFSTATLVPT